MCIKHEHFKESESLRRKVGQSLQKKKPSNNIKLKKKGGGVLWDLCIFHKQTQNVHFSALERIKLSVKWSRLLMYVSPPQNKTLWFQLKQPKCYSFSQTQHHVNRVVETSGGVSLECSTSGSSTDRPVVSQSSANKPELVMRRDNVETPASRH